MKILFFIDSLNAGGKERRLAELMKGLKKKSAIDIEIIVMNTNIHYKQVFDLGIKIHYLIRKTKRDLTVFNKFFKICKDYSPDIVHCWDSMTAVISIPACKYLKVKLINGMVVDTPVKRNILNKCWLRAQLTFPFSDKIIGNSQAGLTAYNAPRRKSVCIYNGIDFNRFQNLKDPVILRKEIFGNPSNELFVVGMVAAFEDRKDYFTLIKAATTLIFHHDIRFLLVGEGTNFHEIKNKIPKHLEDKIILLGRRSDVESIIQIFDIGILLTNSKVHGEGISNSIIEYMASGKPTIATSGGGTNEVVVDDQNGYLINVEDSEQLIKKIEFLKAHKNYRVELGNNGRRLISEKFNLNLMTNHYMSIYENILN